MQRKFLTTLSSCRLDGSGEEVAIEIGSREEIILDRNFSRLLIENASHEEDKPQNRTCRVWTDQRHLLVRK